MEGAEFVQVVIVLVVLAIATVLSFVLLRRLRLRGTGPKFLPTSYLKKKWQAWTPRRKYSQVRSHDRRGDLSSTETAYRGTGTEERAATDAVTAGVDRNTSVRSVITLPAYSQTPKDTEQVIGREGERAGMDTVIEFPETADEEETRREDQMESLYQIRLARRREIAEREERRQQRREARERGDWARLEELRQESRQRATGAASQSTTSLNDGLTLSAATLIAEHQSRGRERRVSSVDYASVGQVRHDGTRVRANSNESERGALLDGAAPMGENETRARGLSEATFSSSLSNLPRPSVRGRSGSSAMSISTTASDLDHPAQATPGSTQPEDGTLPRNSQSSDPPTSGTSNSSPTANRFTPDDSTASDDIGESRIPALAGDDGDSLSRPPDYDHLDWGDAPAYEAAIQARRAASNASARAQGLPQRTSSNAPPLPQINLPRIHVEGASEPNTPVIPSANDETSSRQPDVAEG